MWKLSCHFGHGCLMCQRCQCLTDPWILIEDLQVADAPESSPPVAAMEEASAPALELSPANSGVPLLLSLGTIRAGDSSEDCTSSCGLGLETSEGARPVFKHSRHKSDQADCGISGLGTELTLGTDRKGAARRNTAEVAPVSRDRDHQTRSSAEQRTTGHIPFRSPFEAHAHRDIGDGGSGTEHSSSTAAGYAINTANIEEGDSDTVVFREQSAPSQPDDSASGKWQNPLTGSSSSGEQALATNEAASSSLLNEGNNGSLAYSSGSPHGACPAPASAGEAADVSIRAEMEMVSLGPKKHPDVFEAHSFLEEHTESEMAMCRRRSIPCRTPSEASLMRPKFSITVYAGWLPPSLRASPTGGWMDNGLTDRQMGSSDEWSLHRSRKNSLDLTSMPLLPLP